MKLTKAQEDYLEAIYNFNQNSKHEITVSELAKELSCKLPTVSRTIQKLTEGGFVNHKSRGCISLTQKGECIGEQILHRHQDVENFLHHVLGVNKDQAKIDCCKIEHGFSSDSAQRLHLFMEYFNQLSPKEKRRIGVKMDEIDDGNNRFGKLILQDSNNWRH